MTTKLELYNGALDFIGTRTLFNLSEEGKERRALDRIFDEATEFLLQQAAWNFAIRASEFTPDNEVDPLFGFEYAYTRPDDYARLVSISQLVDFSDFFEEYETEQRYWFANPELLYVRYVSTDSAYGNNLADWPQSFALAHQAYMAFKSGLTISSDKGNRNDLFNIYERLLGKAKTLDALEERAKRKPSGSWVGSRRSGRSARNGR